MTIEILYGAFVMYLLGVLFFFEAFSSDEEGAGVSYLITAFMWPYIALKLIVLRLLHGKQED